MCPFLILYNSTTQFLEWKYVIHPCLKGRTAFENMGGTSGFAKCLSNRLKTNDYIFKGCATNNPYLSDWPNCCTFSIILYFYLPGHIITISVSRPLLSSLCSVLLIIFFYFSTVTIWKRHCALVVGCCDLMNNFSWIIHWNALRISHFKYLKHNLIYLLTLYQFLLICGIIRVNH